MYLSYYDLKAKPFELNPDPAFLWIGEKHQGVLAEMTYAIFENKGLLVLTGDVGTGKTTLINALISNLGDDITYAKISNPGLDTLEFFSFIAIGFQMARVHYRSKGEFLIDFEEFLKTSHEQNKKVLLIIEEAQNLSFELLEETRLISNMESADEKLINIFLVGQQGLNEKLNDPRCRSLQQRTINRFQIRPLDLDDTQEYLATRLKIAGAKKGKEIFSKGAIEAIYQYSEGYPRIINRLADNVLLLGYSKEKRKITPDLVSQCHEDMDLKAVIPAGIQRGMDLDDIKRKKHVSGVRQWKWAAVLLSALIIVGVGMSWHLYRASRVSDQAPLDVAAKDQVLVAQKMSPETEDLDSENKTEQETPFDIKRVQTQAEPSIKEVPVSPQEVPAEEPEAPPPLVAKAPKPELLKEMSPERVEPPVFIEPSTETVIPTEERVEPKAMTEPVERETLKVPAEEPEAPPPLVAKAPKPELLKEMSPERVEPPVFIGPSTETVVPTEDRVEPKTKSGKVELESSKVAAIETTPEKKPVSQEAIPKPVQSQELTVAQKTLAQEKSAATQSSRKVSPSPAESQAPPETFGSSVDKLVSTVDIEKSQQAIQAQEQEIRESASPEAVAPTEEKISSDAGQKVAVKSPEVTEPQASIRTETEHEYMQNRLEAFLALYCQTYQDKQLDKFATFFTTDATEKGQLFSSLMPKYRRNFERIDSLNYRIELKRHSVQEKTGYIHIEGIFRAQARLVGEVDKWRYSFGDISMELVPVGNFFKVRRLDYKIR